MNSGEYAEFELLETLERGLSAAYTLFHSVDWSRGVGSEEQHGEIDIVVLNQAGDVLLLEVKAGDVEVKPDGIFKTYSGQPKDVTRQINKPAESRTSGRSRAAALQRPGCIQPARGGQHHL